MSCVDRRPTSIHLGLTDTIVADVHARSALRASFCGDLVVPLIHRRISDRLSQVAAPRAWNRLPTDPRTYLLQNRSMDRPEAAAITDLWLRSTHFGAN